MAHDHHEQSSDMKAAFTGLIVGAIILFAVVRSIVSYTNHKYAGEKSHAEATK